MDKTRFLAAHVLGQMGKERDHVMLGDGFDLVDPGNVELDILGFPDRLGILARDHAQIGHCIAGMGFDLVPDAEFRFRGPDGDHVGAGIAGDHWQQHRLLIASVFARVLDRSRQVSKTGERRTPPNCEMKTAKPRVKGLRWRRNR